MTYYHGMVLSWYDLSIVVSSICYDISDHHVIILCNVVLAVISYMAADQVRDVMIDPIFVNRILQKPDPGRAG